VSTETGVVVSVIEMTRELGGIDPQYLHVTVETDLGPGVQSGDRVTITTGAVLPSRDALEASVLAVTGTVLAPIVVKAIADRIIADAGVPRG
jgi:hypothetical protein